MVGVGLFTHVGFHRRKVEVRCTPSCVVVVDGGFK